MTTPPASIKSSIDVGNNEMINTNVGGDGTDKKNKNLLKVIKNLTKSKKGGFYKHQIYWIALSE